MSNTDKGTPELVVEVDVQAATALNGNTADKKYLYTFDPSIALVEKSNTRLIYRLSDKTRANLVISGIYTNDGRYQLSRAVIADDARSVSLLNVNTQRMLINVMLQVTDRASNTLIHADPEVLNEPEVPQ